MFVWCCLIIAFAGWWTAFISQCVAESNDLLSGYHHVWFNIFIHLFLFIAILFLVISNAVMSPLRRLVIIFLIVGIILSVLHCEVGLWDDNNESLQSMGAGYLLLLVADLFMLVYFVLFEDSLWFGTSNTSAGAVSGSSAGMGGVSGGGGIIPSFTSGGAGVGSSSGIRNRFSGFGGKMNPLKKSSYGEGESGAAPAGAFDIPSAAPAGENIALSEDTRQAHGTGAGSVIPQQDIQPGGPSCPPRNLEEVRATQPTTGASDSLNYSSVPGAETAPNASLSTAQAYPPYEATHDTGLAPPIVGSTTEPYSTTTQPDSVPVTAGAAAAAPPAQGLQAVQRAEALYTYKASEDDPTEISFNKGDLLEIVDSSGKWWQARRPNGELGIVPSNYLRML